MAMRKQASGRRGASFGLVAVLVAGSLVTTWQGLRARTHPLDLPFMHSDLTPLVLWATSAVMALVATWIALAWLPDTKPDAKP